MEQLKKYNKLKLNASSLVESVIAMTIISVCILVAINIYAMVLKSSKPIIYYKINSEKQNIINNIKNNRLFTNETYNFNNFNIDQTVINYKGNNQLYQISLTAIHNKDSINSIYLIKNNTNE